MKIKLVISFIIYIALLVGQSHAQMHISLGIKGGLVSNENIISGDGFTSYSAGYGKLSSQFGVTAQFFFSKYFTLNPEISYIRRGMNFREFDGAVQNPEYPMTSYLSIDLLVALRIANKIVVPYFFIGPRVERLLASDPVSLSYTFDHPHIKVANWGFTSGIGVEKEISKTISILFDVRYCHDFSNAALVEPGPAVDNIDFYTNSSFNFLVGVNYNFSSKK